MSWDNYQMWLADRDSQIAFFQARKEWARELLRSKGLAMPGQSIKGIFAGCEFLVTIGPRGGVKVLPLCEKARNSSAQIRSGRFELPPQPWEGW